MICNSSLTVYHKKFDEENRIETWKRYNYSNVWFFDRQGARVNKGYVDSDNAHVRIPYDMNSRLEISNFAIGDIVYKGTLNVDITTQQDLREYKIYNITSITNNDFGNNKHIHLIGE